MKADDAISLEFSEDIDTFGKYQTADGEWHKGSMDDFMNNLAKQENKLTIKMAETIDEFIFTTINPWCEQKCQHILKKRDLEQALTRYFKKGHWISREGNGQVLPFWERYQCSECGEFAENKNFCPNCGADMKEVSE